MREIYVSKEGVITPKRQPVATEVVLHAARLANCAQDLAERVKEKLHPVMTSDLPQPREESLSDSREYPPLFADLRTHFDEIATALNIIERAIQRTEL